VTTTWMHPLARAARVLAARLIELEKRLPKDDPAGAGWEDYLRTAQLLADVVEAQKAAVPAIVVKGGQASGVSPAAKAK
jgi:hypothetical protein